MHVASLFQFYNDSRRVHEQAKVVAADELATVQRFFDWIQKADKDSAPASFALRGFKDLDNLPFSSNHQVLGCFACIESLITHNPNDKEIGDSLTHQLKIKLTLLEKMFCRTLDFTLFGLNEPVDVKAKQRIWRKLYEYRSFIAHGKQFDFDREFAALKSRDAALDFLREVTKLVILLSLEKPEFIEHLKEV